MTSDDPRASHESEPLPSRDIQLGKMWVLGAFGAVGVAIILVIAPTNPAGWILLASLGVLLWITRIELQRRKKVQQTDKEP